MNFDNSVVGTIFLKERDKFTPSLKFGSAVEDPSDSFAFTMVWENSINSTIRRIYSGHSDHFLNALHFQAKINEFAFWPIKIFTVTQDLQHTSTFSKKWRGFFNNPHPLVLSVISAFHLRQRSIRDQPLCIRIWNLHAICHHHLYSVYLSAYFLFFCD